MKQAAIALSIGPPAQVRMGIDGALGGLAKQIWPAERQDAAQNAAQRHFVNRPRRFAGAPPYLLIRIGEDRVAHLRETRASIRLIFIRDLLDSNKVRLHGLSPVGP